MLDTLKLFLLQHPVVPIIVTISLFLGIYLFRTYDSTKPLTKKWKLILLCFIGFMIFAAALCFRYFVLNSIYKGMIGFNVFRQYDDETATSHSSFTPDDVAYFCNDIPKSPMDRRNNKEKLVVMHYNAEFMFSPAVLDIITTRKRRPMKPPFLDAQAHAKSIAKVLDRYDADIINLCEISDCGALDLVRSYMKKSELYKPYVVKQNDRETNQSCGLLTKIDPVKELVEFKKSDNEPISPSKTCGETNKPTGKTKTVSKAYRARFEVNNIPIVLMGLHLIAFPNLVERCLQREAQAKIIARDIKEGSFHDLKNDELIIVGDFNDYDWNVQNDVGSKYPKSNVLQRIAESRDLRNVLLKIEQDRRFTAINSGKKRKNYSERMKFDSIDHALISKNLYDSIATSQVASFYQPWSDSRCSDHFPIWFEIDMNVVKSKREGKTDLIPKSSRTLEKLPKLEDLPSCSAAFDNHYAFKV